MATVSTAISATGTSSTPLAAAATPRKTLYIKNYNESANAMYVAFGTVATAGTAGEMEFKPGDDFKWTASEGGPTYVGDVPQEAVSVICAGSGTASGAIETE